MRLTMKSFVQAVTVTALLAIMVTGCSPISVTNDYDQSYDFSKLKTFGFIPISAESGIDGINADRLGTAIKSELTAKGYTPSDKADFGIALYFTKKTKTDIQSYGYGYGYGYGWRGVGVGDVTVTQYDEGTLIIDFIDMTDNKLVWRGAGTGTLADNPSAEERTARINEAVAAIISQFPPTKAE